MPSRRCVRTVPGNDPRSRGRRLLSGLVVAALTLPALLLPAQTAAASPTQQQPPGGGAVELNAMTAPSVVYLQITDSGYMRTGPNEDWLGPYDVVSTCTGFFVTGTGHIVSAGHCVEPAEGRKSFIEGALAQEVQRGTITEADKQTVLAEAQLNWQVEGRADGSPLAQQVLAVQPTSVPGAVLVDPLPAQVLDFRQFADGDLALLKVEVATTPPLPIAQSDPASGTPITAIGFPGSVTGVVNPTTLPNPTFNSGTVASTQVNPNGVARIGVNAAISGGMSGGPTIDQFGNVVGVNSSGIEGEPQPFNFVTDTTDLRDWIGAKNLALAPPRTAADQDQPVTDDQSPGIPSWVWIVVGAVVLLIVVGVVLLVVLGRRGGSGPAPYIPAQRGPSPIPPGTYGPQPGPSAPWNPFPDASPSGRGYGPGGGSAAGGVATEAFPAGTCPRCRASNGPGSRFCNGCGSAI